MKIHNHCCKVGHMLVQIVHKILTVNSPSVKTVLIGAAHQQAYDSSYHVGKIEGRGNLAMQLPMLVLVCLL